MASNDYVKFVTQQIVSYMDQPKEQRRELKQQKKEARPPLSTHLFGMLPIALSMMLKRKRER